MARKNRFVQDTEVLIYRLNHANIEEAKRLVEQICLVAESLAQDLESGDRKQFLQGTSELMARFRKRIVELEEAGFVMFGFAGGVFARFLSNTPVRSVDDLKGKKVWVPEGDQISYRAMEALNLSPVTLPVTDVLTGLQPQVGLIQIVSPAFPFENNFDIG